MQCLKGNPSWVDIIWNINIIFYTSRHLNYLLIPAEKWGKKIYTLHWSGKNNVLNTKKKKEDNICFLVLKLTPM